MCFYRLLYFLCIDDTCLLACYNFCVRSGYFRCYIVATMDSDLSPGGGSCCCFCLSDYLFKDLIRETIQRSPVEFAAADMMRLVLFILTWFLRCCVLPG